jgi:glycosyltransferase involved in cell wall biosynthesis
MKKVDVSICIASWNKAGFLKNTLKSIRDQNPKVNYEIVVVDDGSTDKTKEVCRDFDVVYHYLDRPSLENSAIPRNLACEIAKGKVLLMQSDDVVHMPYDYCQRMSTETYVRRGLPVPEHIRNMSTDCTIDKLYEVPEKGVHWAACLNVKFNVHNPAASKSRSWYVNWWGRMPPLFFIGSMHKSDFWDIGGNDPNFIKPGYEDTYMGKLMQAVYNDPRGNKCIHRDDIIGFHQHHKKRYKGYQHSYAVYRRKLKNEFQPKVKELKRKIYGEE